MESVVRKPFLIIILLLSLALTWEPAATAHPPLSKSSMQVKESMEHYWDYLTQSNLYYLLKSGKPFSRMPGASYEDSVGFDRRVRRMLEELQSIDRTEITYDESLSFQLLEWVMQKMIMNHRYYWLQCPIGTYNSQIPNMNLTFSQFEFHHPDDLKRYMDLMDQYPRLIRQINGVLKKQYKRKIILAKPALINSRNYIKQLIESPKESFMYPHESRFKKTGISRKEIRRFQNRVARVIRAAVNPALKEMVDFISGDYMKHAPLTVGTVAIPERKRILQGTGQISYLTEHYTGTGL